MTRKIPYVAVALVSTAAWFWLTTCVDEIAFTSIYDQKLQLAFFSAFLTSGSFLLAMKAFILVRLRDDVYKHDGYRKRYLDQNSNTYRGNYYQGLADLGHLLVASVAAYFLAAIAQITVGFSSIYKIKLIAPCLGGGVLVLVLIDWLVVYLNLRDWFNFIECDVKMSMEKPSSVEPKH